MGEARAKAEADKASGETKAAEHPAWLGDLGRLLAGDYTGVGPLAAALVGEPEDGD